MSLPQRILAHNCAWTTPRTPYRNALAVFIHGFTGAGWKTWAEFPKLVHDQHDRTINSYDIALFDYESNWISQPPLAEVIQALRSFLNEVQHQYDTIAIIGHSLGGIIAKLFIIDELLAQRGDSLKIDLVIACATPHRGIGACNVLYLLKAMPLVGKFIPHNQLCELASWSPSIQRLKQWWSPQLISTEPASNGPGRRCIRSITVSYDEWLVSRKSAQGFFVDEPDLSANPGHSASAGHKMTADKVFGVFYGYLEDHASPARVIDDIREIRTDPERKRAFVERNLIQVADCLAKNLPLLGPDFLSAARVKIDDFLIEFPGRPLRAVKDVNDALSKFTSRKVKEVLSGGGP